MKILTLSDVYFPRVNGVSTSIATFHREFQKRGHEVVLYAPTYGNEAREPEIRRLPARQIPFDPEDRMMSTSPLLTQLEELRREAFDVLHIQTPFLAHRAGVRLGRRLGLPIVETYHTYFEQYLFHYIPFLPRPLMRFVARHFSKRQCNQVDGVVVPSTAMEQVLRDYGVRSHIEKIPTGLRLEEFASGDGLAFKKRHGISRDRPTLVHIGRVAFEKNIDFLIRMLREVRKVRRDVLLIIAGEGPAVPHLQKLTQDLDLTHNVFFVGYQKRETELLDCYRAGDAFVFASKTETQGLVLLEAMALGVPVVSLAAMGTKDILFHGRGALIAEEDEKTFAKQVLKVLDEDTLRRDLARQAVEYAQTWSAGRMAERMLEFYGLIGERRLAAASRNTQAPSPLSN